MSNAPDTVHGLLAAYRRKQLSPVEVLDEHLARLDELEPQLNAFVVVDAAGARVAAKASAARWARSQPQGVLDGIPVTVKDIVAMKGFPTGEGSAIASDMPADEDCPPVARMREANAVFLGKTTTSEFGWKGMTDTPKHGITRNPWDLDHTPGGSSGGAAASLAAGIGVVAHGSDGGGSIRIPSSYCGLVGLKPSYGRVPQAPVGSPFVSLVSNGALTRSVEDAALLLNVLSQPDIRDWHAVPHDGRDWRVGINDGLQGLRIAYSETYGGATVETEVARCCRRIIDQLSDAGAAVTEVGPIIEPLRPALEGYWKAGFATRLQSIPSDRWDELDPGFRQLAQEGMAFDVHQMSAANAARAELVETMRRFHLDHDILLTPTMPTPPPPVDVVYHSPGFDRWDHAVPFTVPFNYSGQPAASIPAGTSADPVLPVGGPTDDLAPTPVLPVGGPTDDLAPTPVLPVGGPTDDLAPTPVLPIGLQVVATHFREDLVLRAARAILDITGWRWTMQTPGGQ